MPIHVRPHIGRVLALLQVNLSGYFRSHSDLISPDDRESTFFRLENPTFYSDILDSLASTVCHHALDVGSHLNYVRTPQKASSYGEKNSQRPKGTSSQKVHKLSVSEGLTPAQQLAVVSLANCNILQSLARASSIHLGRCQWEGVEFDALSGDGVVWFKSRCSICKAGDALELHRLSYGTGSWDFTEEFIEGLRVYSKSPQPSNPHVKHSMFNINPARLSFGKAEELLGILANTRPR
ncbi:hypothetical protein BDY19DRAFT_908026 [Irpex rosettiformis]|uniref:Uncharacterized protein n=1 Tax=Irpex rosettiformis TaxID=378272 RepID=A0ACB8TXT5_9APHY|nr:hypothetical protein BDY19DRAFT_908026 [Irpex rosettiformis]